MSESSTADSRFTTTECLDPGDWQCYRKKASSSFLTLFSAQMQPPATPSKETLQRRVGVNAKEAERYSDGVPGGSSRPAALCICILSPGGSWNRELGEVKVRSWSCSNTLDYRRGPHPSTPECSRVGTSAAAEQHVSGGTREKKERKKKKSACTRSTSGTSSSHDGKSQEVNRENVNPHRRLQIPSLYY